MKRNARMVWPAQAILLGMVMVFTGCDSSPARIPAHATLAPATMHCQVASVALPADWTWYHDTAYPFQIAYPTNWRSGSFEYSGGANVTLSHVVDFFPPGSAGQASSMGKMRGDVGYPVINVEADIVPLTAQSDPATNSYFHADSPRICLNGAPATVYTLVDDRGNVEKTAILQIDHDAYHYIFTMSATSTSATQEIPVFAEMLSTFATTGT